MKDNLDIEKLFKEKFESFKPEVDAKVWQNIASSTGASSVVATSGAGVGLWLKGIIIGGAAVTSIAVGTWLYIDNENRVQEDTVVENVEVDKVNASAIQTNKPEVSIIEKPDDLDRNTETIAENNAVSSPTEATNTSIVTESSVKTTVVVPENGTKKPEISSKKTIETRKVPYNKVIDSGSETSMPEKESAATTTIALVTEKNTEKVTDDTKIKEVVENIAVTENNSGLDQPIQPELDSEFKSFVHILPNVFTPNNDRIHDEFFIETENIEEFYIMIYSKENVKLFESSDPNFKWDGFDMRGQKVPKGDYYYLIKAIGKDKVPHSLPGKLEIR